MTHMVELKKHMGFPWAAFPFTFLVPNWNGVHLRSFFSQLNNTLTNQFSSACRENVQNKYTGNIIKKEDFDYVS